MAKETKDIIAQICDEHIELNAKVIATDNNLARFIISMNFFFS